MKRFLISALLIAGLLTPALAFWHGSVPPVIVPTINWTAEGDSLTAGLGGTPTYAHVILSLLSGAAQTGGNTPTVGTISGVGAVTINNIATSGISAITIDQNYSTRAGAAYDAAKTLNVLSLLIGTNTSGSSDASAQQKYFFIRDYFRKAEASGYQRKILFAVPARNDDGGSFWTSTIVPLDTLLSTYFASDLRCDGYVDLVADARFSPNTAADNTANYNTDKLHPVAGLVGPPATGQQAMASLGQATVLAALQGAGTKTQVLSWSAIAGDQNGSITLSNGNRTATTSTGSQNIVGFPATKGANKIYFEVAVPTTTGFSSIGLANESYDFSANIISSTNSVAFGGNGSTDGNFYVNNVAVRLHTPAMLPGSTIQIAWDQGTQLIWGRERFSNGTFGNWNASGTADPVAEVDGLSTSSIGSGYIHPAIQPSASMTSNFGASQVIGPIPSGYSAYGP